MSEKEFNVSEKINLPRETFSKEIKGYYFILDGNKASWLILGKDEFDLFIYLQKYNIIDSLQKYSIDNPEIYEKDILKIIKKLLVKIEKEEFYDDTEELEQEDIDNIKKSVHLELTNNCNLRCKHCYMSAGILDKKEINYDKLISFFDEYIDIYPREVIISGGEPLTYNKIWDLLFYLKEKGHKIILFSNGLLINEKNIDLIKKYVSEVQLSMEGISRKSFEYIRGINTYESFIKSLEILKENNIKTTLAITVIDENIGDIDNNLLPFLKELEYKNLNIRLNDEVELSGNAINLKNQNFEFNYNRKIYLNNIILKLKNAGYYEEKSATKRTKILNCGIGTSILLDYTEKIYPCSKKGCISFDLEKILNNKINLERVFSDLNDNMSVEYMPKCMECELKYICSGGCRIENININKDWTIPICDKQQKYEMLLIDYLREEDLFDE